MPGTTRYSATFDRTYEEEDRAKASSPPNARRSRSQSWQANSGFDGRQYTPFMGRSPGPRSSSTDNSPNKGTEHIPTRTAKTSVKAHNNPFQFVKVGTCPLYKKAEEQLKKAKEIKKPDVLKEEEEEWQTNLDSWKSRRRKMSEDVFRRQEELKLLELEEQIAQVSQKKTKTFSEMVESRATRGRALSLCLLTSPLEFQNWEFENKTHKNGSCSYTDESGENSTVNSEDEGVSVRTRLGETSHNENEMNHRTNGDAHIEHNGSALDKQNGNCNKLPSDVQLKPKENSYIDSGLESISSSHRAGDTPDSGSDFSQDSNSSIDCDSPRTGVNVLEEFTSKSSQMSEGYETNISLKLDEKGQDFGFTFLGGKDEGQVIIASILEGSKAESSGVHLGDRIITIDSCDVNSKKHIEIAALIQKGREKGQMNLVLWRHNKTTKGTNGFNAAEKHDKMITDENLNAKSYEKSVESENEMYVDDFEELKRQSELLALNKESDTAITNSQAPSKENKSSNKDAKPLKTSVESSTAPNLKTNTPNSAVEEPDKNEQKIEINSAVNNESQKKNIIKVKRTRRKGVYALNVDPNQISQEGNSTNSLFPLSPVTELPSPADETKTISSTLSSNNTLSVFNSQNIACEKVEEKTSEIKPDIPIFKETSSVSTLPKSEVKHDATLVASLKKEENVENKIEIKVENKIETENMPSVTPTSPLSEKPKTLSIPKKNKPSKLKKDLASEKKSACSKNTTEVSCSAADKIVKNVTQEKVLSESKSFGTVANNQSHEKNDQENFKVSKAVENNSISSENTSVEPATEIVIAPNKTSVSNNNGTESLKVVANKVDSSTDTTQSKASTSENNKPKKIPAKKVITKAKGNTIENTSTGTSALNEIYSTKDQNSSSLIEKQEKAGSKNETAVSPLKEENSVTVNGIASVSQELKPLPPKDEVLNLCPSTNKVRDLTLKFGDKNSSSRSDSQLLTKNAKTVKSPVSEKPKSVLATKVESPKIKQGVKKTTKSSLENASDASSAAASTVNVKENKSKQESKSLPLTPDKQSNLTAENKTVVPSLEKDNSVQQIPPPKMTKGPSMSSTAKTSDSAICSTDKESKTKEEKIVSADKMEKQPENGLKNKTVTTPLKTGNSHEQVPSDYQQVANKLPTSSNSKVPDSPSCKNQIKGNESKNEKETSSVSQVEQAKTASKNETKLSPLAREKDILSLDIAVKDATKADKELHKLPSATAPTHNPTSIIISDNKSDSNIVSSEISFTKPEPAENSPDEKPKLSNPKRSRNRSRKKNANSQKVNMPAKSNEESKNSNDSLNIVFQSQPQTMCSENLTNNIKNFENNSIKTPVSTDLVADVPPVDKIAEEMEKLILEQLEAEERAKELSSGKISVESSPEHLLTAPPRLAEPPKEKPPPPPSSEGSPKDPSLKRVNSTKRIKKEMYKRRSNFLGIDNADESLICSELSVPPPPALEEILKAEMELDRQTRLKIESESSERLSLEEKEIRLKEREIIESLESEERQKMYLNSIEDCNNVFVSNTPCDAVCEEDRIETLKYERKRLDAERQLTEEQQQMLLEEKQLKEREEFIRQQETAEPLSDSSLSVSENTANNLKKPALSTLPAEVQSNGLLLGANGDGNCLTLSSSAEISGNETSKRGKKVKASEKPAVPPKPLKKKEAIRKERERLRQEQEALQREREEHRRKLMLEQEELMKHQKTHAPDAPASRLGPHPPHVQPFPSQLTTTTNATLNARENASFPSRSHHGTSNGTAGNVNTVELMSPPVVRQNRLPSPRKAVQNEAWGQQKMSSVRKQNHESLTESRYNQNHWLIQEAEMRRITEFKERQRTSQPSCTQTHLAEDDVCSNPPPRVPVISPTHNPHLNYPVQDKMWNYGQTNMPLKKYPPPVVKEPPLHTIYPRETVPQQPPTKPSRVVPSERQEQMLSVSGRKRCSHCNEELGRGAAMIIESLQLYYHIHCFQCCVCQAQLGNGSCGTDVRVRNNKLHCHNCYSNDEAGLKFSQV